MELVFFEEMRYVCVINVASMRESALYAFAIAFAYLNKFSYTVFVVGRRVVLSETKNCLHFFSSLFSSTLLGLCVYDAGYVNYC